jgi:hypothetical protein
VRGGFGRLRSIEAAQRGRGRTMWRACTSCAVTAVTSPGAHCPGVLAGRDSIGLSIQRAGTRLLATEPHRPAAWSGCSSMSCSSSCQTPAKARLFGPAVGAETRGSAQRSVCVASTLHAGAKNVIPRAWMAPEAGNRGALSQAYPIHPSAPAAPWWPVPRAAPLRGSACSHPPGRSARGWPRWPLTTPQQTAAG